MFLEQNRSYSLIDCTIAHIDHGLRTLFGKPLTTKRPSPGKEISETELSLAERRQVLALMRVNHSGEVAAQGLYQGQALTCRDPLINSTLEQSAQEENDHLVWCKDRLQELGGQTSFLNPIWYLGSLCIGMLAGMAGDTWSLGFVEETEHQVTLHLSSHEQRLPAHDQKTASILAQMKIDEANHADKARYAGAYELPTGVKYLMQLTAKIMTSTAYYI